MADTNPKDLLGKLAEAGEEALHKLADVPGGSKVLEAVNGMRARLDDVSKKLRALDPLERRVAELERRLKALESPQASASSARKPAAKKPA